MKFKPNKFFEFIHSFLVAANAHRRSFLQRKQLATSDLKGARLSSAKYILVIVARNESVRLIHLFEYYRKMGFEHFLVIDNESTDGLVDIFGALEDVTIFKASGSYRGARYGVDWVNCLVSKYCSGKWILHVDADEYFLPLMDEPHRIADVADRVSAGNRLSLNCVMLDMYSEGEVQDAVIVPGRAPLEQCCYFDGAGYRKKFEPRNMTTWIRGGVRERVFFGVSDKSPALNKTPFVLWKKHYVFLKSAHELWPYHLNGSRNPCQNRIGGALLHFKFMSDFTSKVIEEASRNQHTEEYNAYNERTSESSAPILYSPLFSRRLSGVASITNSDLFSEVGPNSSVEI